MAQLSLWFSIFCLFMVVTNSTTFTLVNKCDYTVWPGILTNAGVPPLPTTGFVLETGQTQAIAAPAAWGGRFWGRSQCTQDAAGRFTCLTGDCGSGTVECAGNGALPPATLAEFTLDGSGGMDFFDVSLVDGYNLPMLVAPQGGSGENCNRTGCVVDLNDSCPAELKVTSAEGDGVACKSACEAFQQPEYCCSGAYGTPDTCKPSQYSEVFKTACPSAYSYAYDDKTSTFTCTNADYTITFCPSPNTSQKSTQSQSQDTDNNSRQPNQDADNKSPAISSGMVYEGALDQSQLSSSVLRSEGAERFMIITVAVLWLWML